MNNLISGKEAKLAWANGEELEFIHEPPDYFVEEFLFDF